MFVVQRYLVMQDVPRHHIHPSSSLHIHFTYWNIWTWSLHFCFLMKKKKENINARVADTHKKMIPFPFLFLFLDLMFPFIETFLFPEMHFHCFCMKIFLNFKVNKTNVLNYLTFFFSKSKLSYFLFLNSKIFQKWI